MVFHLALVACLCQAPPLRIPVTQGETLRFGTATSPAPRAPQASEGGRVDPLTPLERLAACFKVAGLPDPFLAAELTLSPDSYPNLEFGDARMLMNTPLAPIRLHLTLTPAAPSLENPPLVYDLEGPSGYASLRSLPAFPAAYLGGSLAVRSDRPVFAYCLPAAEAVWRADRTDYVFRLVAPLDSKRRIVLQRSGIREHRLPGSPDAMAADPETFEEWERFLRVLGGPSSTSSRLLQASPQPPQCPNFSHDDEEPLL